MNWVQQLTRSGPHAWRPPKESKSRSVVWSASGSGHSFPARSENSCWTTRGCAMRCAGPCSIAEGLARNIGVAQQPWACSHLTTNRGVGAPSGRGSGFIHNLLTYHIENKTYEKTMLAHRRKRCPSGIYQRLEAPGLSPPQQRLRLGEGLFYGVEVRRVGRQENQRAAAPLDELAYPPHLVDLEVVHHHDLPFLQLRAQEALDVEREGLPVGRSFYAHRSAHPF